MSLKIGLFVAGFGCAILAATFGLIHHNLLVSAVLVAAGGIIITFGPTIWSKARSGVLWHAIGMTLMWSGVCLALYIHNLLQLMVVCIIVAVISVVFVIVARDDIDDFLFQLWN